MRLLRAADHRRMAWKNGGGETIEIAVHPTGAGLADFDWRVSMARVAADGPFSVFPGIDRTLAILEGAGLELAIEGYGRHRLTLDADPFPFPADAPTAARLAGGPVTDLNVMTRRDRWRHDLRRVPSGPSTPLGTARGTVLIICGGGHADLVSRTARARLAAQDAARVDDPHGLTVAAEPGSDIYVVRVSPVTDACVR